MSILFHLHVLYAPVCLVPSRSGEGVGSPGDEVTGVCEPPFEGWAQNRDPLQK